MKNIFLTILLFILSLTASAATTTPDTQLQKLINPEKGTQQWLGADAATSIATGHGRYIWLFGDTITGESDFPNGRCPGGQATCGFIHNSVGVSTCKNGSCHGIKKYFRKNRQAIFTPPQANTYYWVLSGAMAGSKLFLAACRLEGGTIKGTTFILVSNPQDAPSLWHYKTHDVAGTNSTTNWYTTVIHYKNALYLYGQTGIHGDETTLARLSIANAEKLNWSSHKELGVVSGLPGTSEMSVIQYTNKWYALQISPFGYKASLYFATQPNTKWTLVENYPLPGPWQSSINKSNQHNFFIYAPKLHPEMVAGQNKLVFTFNTNTNNYVIGSKAGTKLFYQSLPNKNYNWLYLPQFWLLTLPS